MSGPAEGEHPDRGAGALQADLTAALADGYLRRVLLGRGGEPTEVGVHRMRFLAPGDEEHTRLVGLRFRGVGGVATQALRRDDDGDGWVATGTDWVGGLRLEEAMPPRITTALLGAPETLRRLADSADDLLWLAGSPDDLAAYRRAPVLFEVAAEGLLITGAEARVRLFVLAGSLEVLDSRGRSSLERLLAEGERFAAAWQAYWDARGEAPDLPEDLRFEWLPPRPFEDGDGEL